MHPELNVRVPSHLASFIPSCSIDLFIEITPRLVSQLENNSVTEAQEQVIVGEAVIS